MRSLNKASKKSAGRDDTTTRYWATDVPLLLDMPGLLYVEACERIKRGSIKLEKVKAELCKHQDRVSTAVSKRDDAQEGAWVEVIQSIGSLEPLFGATVKDLAVADVLLVAAAESFINGIAIHVLPCGEAENFEKLSPVGKWLFLPQIMKINWKPSIARGPLQGFARLVARRNRVVHPRPIKVGGISKVAQFLDKLQLDAKSAENGALAVKELFREISHAWMGSRGPDWLELDEAKKRPPCFILHSVAVPLRLARKSKKCK